MRTIWARMARMDMGLVRMRRSLRRALPQDPPYLGYADRHRQDDDPLEHLDHLLGNEGVDREAALAQRGEEQRGDHDAERVVAADERDGDAEESGAPREAVLVVVLVAEH